MFDRLRELLHMDATEAVDLNAGEHIIHVTGRHWILLLAREIPPLAGVLFFGILAAYRAAGGGFLVTDTGFATGLDWFNIVLVVIEIVLALLWVALWVRRSKDTRARNILLVANAAVLLLIYFRYRGGRIFYIDPGLFANQAGDLWNLIFITLAVACGIATLFTFYDWLNDELILTNQRVIYDNDQVWIPGLIEQRVQEQIYIEDVQNVVASTKTYPQHWLKFGTVIVKSARFRGELQFDQAIDPQLMQKQIMDVVNAKRKERSEEVLQRLIETKVYGEKPQKAVFRRDIKTTRGVRYLTWLLPENPEINEDNGAITWRAHWLFLLRALMGPLVLLLLGLLIVALISRLVLIDPLLIIAGVVAVVIAFLAWAAWEVEDYRNDLYILDPRSVIDIEKKPFGPESRRQAGIGQINNVSFETTFVSNLLGYGNVFLETAGGGGKFTFTHVPRPRDVVAKVNDYYVAAKNVEKEQNMNDNLELLRHYHQAQVRHQEIPPQASTP